MTVGSSCAVVDGAAQGEANAGGDTSSCDVTLHPGSASGTAKQRRSSRTIATRAEPPIPAFHRDAKAIGSAVSARVEIIAGHASGDAVVAGGAVQARQALIPGIARGGAVIVGVVIPRSAQARLIDGHILPHVDYDNDLVMLLAA